MHPGPLLHDVLYGDSNRTYELAEFSYAAGPVADSDLELDQPPLGRQPALQAAAQDRRVDVAAG